MNWIKVRGLFVYALNSENDIISLERSHAHLVRRPGGILGKFIMTQFRCVHS